MKPIITDEDIDDLMGKIKVIVGHSQRNIRDKILAENLLMEMENAKKVSRESGYPISFTFIELVKKLENSFELASMNYNNRHANGFMAKSNFIQELNRGGGSHVHRQIGFILKDTIYNNPTYLAAGNLKMLASVNQLKEPPKKMNVIHRIKQFFQRRMKR